MKAAIMVAFFLLSAAKPFSLVLGIGNTLPASRPSWPKVSPSIFAGPKRLALFVKETSSQEALVRKEEDKRRG